MVQEVATKERELQAAIGIAKMLLERNDALSKKNQKIHGQHVRNDTKQFEKILIFV